MMSHQKTITTVNRETSAAAVGSFAAVVVLLSLLQCKFLCQTTDQILTDFTGPGTLPGTVRLLRGEYPYTESLV